MSIETLASTGVSTAEHQFVPLPPEESRTDVVPAEISSEAELPDLDFPDPFDLRAAHYLGALQSAFNAWMEDRPHVDPDLRKGLLITHLNELSHRVQEDHITKTDIQTSAKAVAEQIAGQLSLIGFLRPANYYQQPHTKRPYHGWPPAA